MKDVGNDRQCRAPGHPSMIPGGPDSGQFLGQNRHDPAGGVAVPERRHFAGNPIRQRRAKAGFPITNVGNDSFTGNRAKGRQDALRARTR